MNKNDQVTDIETREILKLAEKCLNIPGDFAELGCYKGDTSILLGKLLATCAKTVENSPISCGKDVEKVPEDCGKTVDKYQQICAKNVENLAQNCVKPVQKQNKSVENSCKASVKHLWIYDSFAGLPPKTQQDASSAGVNFQGGELFVTKREVVDKIRRAGLKNIIVKKAWFNELQPQDLPTKIAFAFLDGDFYESIKDSLRLVAPLMHPEGIVIVHDYNNPELPGASRAVDEFLRQNPNYQFNIKHSLAILRREKPNHRL